MKRDRGDASTNKGTPKIARQPPVAWERPGIDPFLQASEETNPAYNLHLERLDSRTVKQ